MNNSHLIQDKKSNETNINQAKSQGSSRLGSGRANYQNQG